MVNLPHPEYLAYTVLLTLSVSLCTILVNDSVLDRVIDLMLLIVVLFSLVFMLISIRQLQPDYTRQPIIYSYVPLLIAPFYAIFIDSEILAALTHAAVQGTLIVVFAGMVFMYWKSLERGYLLLLSMLLFITAFVLYWLIDQNLNYVLPVVHLLTGIGMITASFKFPEILVQHKR